MGMGAAAAGHEERFVAELGATVGAAIGAAAAGHQLVVLGGLLGGEDLLSAGDGLAEAGFAFLVEPGELFPKAFFEVVVLGALFGGEQAEGVLAELLLEVAELVEGLGDAVHD